MKQLIVAEMPCIAEKIADAIADEAFVNKKNYLENTTHIITWCIGSWIERTPLNMPDPKFDEQAKEMKHQLGVLKALCVRYDITEIVNACEAGSKSDMIFDCIYDHLKPCKSYNRLWITSYEQSVIKEGTPHLFDNETISPIL